MRTFRLPRAPRHSALRSPDSFSRAGLWRLGLPLGLAMGISACSGSSYRWVKEGLSTSLADAKYASCQREAELAPYSAQESEEQHTTRIRQKAQLCMKADGWSLTRSDGSSASIEPPASEPVPKSELRLAHASEAAMAKGSDKPPGAETDKKVVKEVHVHGGAESGGDDEGE